MSDTKSALFETGLVPIIDLTPLWEGKPSAKEDLAAQLNQACESIGFFAIKGHGIPQHIIDQAWDISRQYFDLSTEEKDKVPMTKDYPYGYMGFKYEQLSAGIGNVRPPDLKESFQVGASTDPSMPLQWPASPAGFQEAWEQYYEAMTKLANSLLVLAAVALNLPENFFADKTDKHMSALRALNYPVTGVPPEKDQFRASPHTDYGSLTILKSGGPGLQVRNKKGEWQNIDPTEDMFVVNLGDLMPYWTNDRWVSTLHRVVYIEGDHERRRQSMAFFHNMNGDARIECIPTCCSESNPPKYPPITFVEHLMRKHKATY